MARGDRAVGGLQPRPPFALAQNYPNPFNTGSVIAFHLPRPGQVTLQVYDVLGQRVATLLSGHRPAGSYSVCWDGTDDSGRALASGPYRYRLQAGRQVAIRSLLVLR